MKILLHLMLALAGASLAASSRAADLNRYPLGPDSMPQPGVPRGELITFGFSGSRIFPGTTREVTVYVPRQYDPAKPACVHVNQDGLQNRANVVFDNLIARGELPVLIGVFVTPGVVRARDPATQQDHFNRSFEYDGLGDAYVRFLLEELLPAVEQKTTSDGRPLRLSRSANDRSIGGQSSGGIAAFTAAWERPEAFSRVFSAIGSFPDLRGGLRYVSLVRRVEPKPIRVFLQDGENDQNIYAGDWFMANQAMERALTYAGYEVSHVWGQGTHNGSHGAAVFPDAMRWLWKDWPKPVAAGRLPLERIAPFFIEGEGWQLVGEGYQFTEGPAVNAVGEVFFNDLNGSKTYRVALDGRVTEVVADTHRANGQHFGPDGRRYVVGGDRKIRAYDSAGGEVVVADGLAGNDLVVAHNGNLYVTNPLANPDRTSKVWLLRPDGTRVEVDSGGVKYANGITLSPDQSLLYVADYYSHWIYAYSVQPDGTLANKQRFDWLLTPDSADDAGPDGIRCDRDGLLYVATRLGIQVCDQTGKVQVIMPTPNHRVANVVFGGAKFDTLFATCGDKVYKRKLAKFGANAWAAPVKPPKPHL
jgi:sugar lactone lactonase YvrE/enterochelin esterase-like enzyme